MAAPASRQMTTEPDSSGLAGEELLRAFRVMYMSRKIDDREILLKRQNKIYFQISAAGMGYCSLTSPLGLFFRNTR